MKEILKLVLFLLLPTSISAETVLVTSGEHANFTRLVLYFKDTPTWNAGTIEEGYGIQIDNSEIAFDLTSVFKRIPRDRVSALTYDKESQILVITSSCACTLNVFELPNEILVVDVETGSPGSNDKFAKPLLATQSAVRINFPELLGASLNASSSIDEVTNSQDELEIQQGASIASLENSLIEQLGRASSQGLMSLSVPSSESAESRSQLDNLANDPAPTNFKVITAIDREALPNSEVSFQTSCVTESTIDIWNWGNPNGADWIHELRSSIADESIEPQDQKLLELVKLYLHLGFGVEARNLLNNTLLNIKESEIYIAMADVIHETENITNSAFLDMTNCNGPAALWAILGTSSLDPGSAVNATAIQRNFYLLPSSLRHHLGPKVAGALRQLEYDEEANAIIESLVHLNPNSNSFLNYLRAEDAIDRGDVKQGKILLRNIIPTGSPQSHIAMVTLLQNSIEENIPESLDTLLLAEGMLRDVKGQNLEYDLLYEISRNYAANENYSMAFEMLRSYKKIETSDVYNYLINKSSIESSDFDFISNYFKYDLGDTFNYINSDSKSLFLDRLVRIGFTQEANSILLENPHTQHDAYRAKAAFRSGDPAAALTIAAGSTDAEALEIRGHSLKKLGNYAAAAQVFRAIGNVEAAAHVAWLSARPDMVDEYGTEIQRKQVRALGTLDFQPENSPLPSDAIYGVAGSETLQDNDSRILSELQSVIDMSASVRSEVGDILQR